MSSKAKQGLTANGLESLQISGQQYWQCNVPPATSSFAPPAHLDHSGTSPNHCWEQYQCLKGKMLLTSYRLRTSSLADGAPGWKYGDLISVSSCVGDLLQSLGEGASCLYRVWTHWSLTQVTTTTKRKHGEGWADAQSPLTTKDGRSPAQREYLFLEPVSPFPRLGWPNSMDDLVLCG